MVVDYAAIPHAVFTHPEVAGVGMGEREAIKKYGKNNIRIGFYRYEDTGKGIAIGAKDYFVKVIILSNNHSILGAHIVGPWASILIQEIINIMYTNGRYMQPAMRAMHIHPAMSEVVQRAFSNLMDADTYHQHISDVYGIDLNG
jgi:dihydrolipoamide dehydrogenase